MHIINRFKNGLSILADSFLLPLKHPVLLIYAIFPAIFLVWCKCNFDTTIPFYKCFFHSSMNELNIAIQKLNAYPVFKYIAPIIILFFVACIFYCYIAYIKHVYNLLQHKTVTVKQMVKETSSRLHLIVAWVLCCMIALAFEYVLTQSSIKDFSTIICIVWPLCTFFILQIIAIEGSFTIKDIQTSMRLTWKSLIEICVGMSLVSLIAYVLHNLHAFSNLAIEPLIIVMLAFKTKIYLLAKNTYTSL